MIEDSFPAVRVVMNSDALTIFGGVPEEKRPVLDDQILVKLRFLLDLLHIFFGPHFKLPLFDANLVDPESLHMVLLVFSPGSLLLLSGHFVVDVPVLLDEMGRSVLLFHHLLVVLGPESRLLRLLDLLEAR